MSAPLPHSLNTHHAFNRCAGVGRFGLTLAGCWQAGQERWLLQWRLCHLCSRNIRASECELVEHRRQRHSRSYPRLSSYPSPVSGKHQWKLDGTGHSGCHTADHRLLQCLSMWKDGVDGILAGSICHFTDIGQWRSNDQSSSEHWQEYRVRDPVWRSSTSSWPG